MIGYRAEDGVATITLARPEKLNALNRPMLEALRDALDRAGQDGALRVVVITGEGRAFSAGQDLAALAHDQAGDILERDYTPLVLRLRDHPLVTVAALNGPAIGAAANLALACDITVAAESAGLIQPFVKIGLVPDAGGTWLLPRIVGLKQALALALTGDSVPAREAQAMGLIFRVFPDDRFAEEVAALAAGLAASSPLACRLIKTAMRESLANSLDAQLALEARLQREAVESEPFRAAVAAFLAKRRG